MFFFKFQVHQNPFSAGAPPWTPVGELMTLPQIPIRLGRKAEARQTFPGFFLKSLLESRGNLLEICLIKFVDTLLCLLHAYNAVFVCVTLLCHFYSTRVARYVPNIAKEGYMRSVWILTTDRPPGQFTHFGIISNGHNSATRHPIPFMFVLGGFSGTVDRTVLFPIGSNLRWRPAAILKNFKWPNLWNALSYSLYVCIQTILCPRTQIYNDWDSKLISQGRVTSRPTV